MMKRLGKGIKRIFVGALIAALGRIKEELEECLDEPQWEDEGGERDVCGQRV